MSMTEPHPGVITSAGFGGQDNAQGPGGLTGLAYQKFDVNTTAYPRDLFTTGRRTTQSANVGFSNPPVPEQEPRGMGNLSPRQFGGMEQQAQQEVEE